MAKGMAERHAKISSGEEVGMEGNGDEGKTSSKFVLFWFCLIYLMLDLLHLSIRTTEKFPCRLGVRICKGDGCPSGCSRSSPFGHNLHRLTF